MNQYIHTPEGVRDIYGREYAARLMVRRRLRAIFHQFGYQDIQTPSFEFFDIFSREKGSVPSRELFKFFDRDGETMVLRPDLTPAIARCAAKYFGAGSMPLRLSYIENAFINRTSLQGRLKEFTQAGVEFLGDGSPDADAEILALTIRCLLAAGLKEFQLEVGHVGFLQGLLEEARFSEEAEEEICRLLENKNFFGVEERIRQSGVSAELAELFIRLPRLFGAIGQVEEARAWTRNARALQAIDRLRQVYDTLCCYGLEGYVSFDLGMTGRYRYYNGMIFKAYTYGSGEPVAAGGRYDHLMEQFGCQAEAVGFAIILDSVMAALNRQDIRTSFDWPQILLVYDENQRKEAIARACCLRAEGKRVQLQRAAAVADTAGEADCAGDAAGAQEEAGMPVSEAAAERRAAVLERCRSRAVSQGFESLYLLWRDGSFQEVAL